MTDPEYISLDEAAKRLGFTKLYTRTLVRRGKLSTVRVPIGPESSVWKHMILAVDVEKFKVKKEKSSGNNRRPDGRNKYILYATPKELEGVKLLLRGSEFSLLADLIARPPQASAYQRRKKKAIAKLQEQAK